MMGAWKSVRNAVLLGLLLFVVFSKPFSANISFNDWVGESGTAKFAEQYGLKAAPGDAIMPEGRGIAANAGAIDITLMFFDPRVRIVTPYFYMVDD